MELRIVHGGGGEVFTSAVVVKPLPCFRAARDLAIDHTNDLRSGLHRRLRRRFLREGLRRYLLAPAGRQSIDISHHLVNKHAAVEWLIRRLGIEGVGMLGEPLGVNAVYFGDEVVAEGNDLPVADVPGIQVFAVNADTLRVPFAPNIEVPVELTGGAVGPAATRHVLADLCAHSEEALGGERCAGPAQYRAAGGALRRWKERRLRQRVEEKAALLARPPAAAEGGGDGAGAEHQPYVRLSAAAAVLTALCRDTREAGDFAGVLSGLLRRVGQESMRAAERDYAPFSGMGLSAPRDA